MSNRIKSLLANNGLTLRSWKDLPDQGLTDNDRFDIGIEASYRPHERVNLWANYQYDYIEANQDQGGDTWDSETLDTAHNASASIDVVLIPGLLDLDVSYFLQKARAETDGGGTAEDFPDIKDKLQAVTTGLSIHPLDFLTVRAIYRWEKYTRSNFHERFPITNTTDDIYLQNRIDNYDAHILGVSAIVSF